jgi:hypothetical protein
VKFITISWDDEGSDDVNVDWTGLNYMEAIGVLHEALDAITNYIDEDLDEDVE